MAKNKDPYEVLEPEFTPRPEFTIVEGSSSKFQVITNSNPPMPAKCAACNKAVRASEDDPVVDFGVSEDYYGAFLMCVTCATELAGAVGYTLDRSAEYEVKLAELKEELDDERAKLDVMRNFVSTFGPDSNAESIDDEAEESGSSIFA